MSRLGLGQAHHVHLGIVVMELVLETVLLQNDEVYVR